MPIVRLGNEKGTGTVKTPHIHTRKEEKSLVNSQVTTTKVAGVRFQGQKQILAEPILAGDVKAIAGEESDQVAPS